MGKRNKTILIFNGSGGCGKDTTAEIMSKYVNIEKTSSINIIKNIVAQGIGRGLEKNEEYRLLLQRVKEAFIRYNDLPYWTMVAHIQDFISTSENDCLLIDVREAEEIEKLKAFCDNKGVAFKTVLVINRNVPLITTNSADEFVYNYTYDYILDNSGTLGDLEDSVITLLENLKYEVSSNE